MRRRCRAALAGCSPARAILHNPIKKSLFKADIKSGFFTLNPLVLQDFISLRKKFLVERRVLEETIRFLRLVSHGVIYTFLIIGCQTIKPLERLITRP